MNNWQNDDGGKCEGAEADRLDALLDELKEAEPPAPGLVNDVMTRIRNISNPVVHRTTGETVMAKKALIGLAAAAAVLIAVFATTGWPPTLPGSEGTIGAAKRHQAQQMSPADVKLGDTATQEFLQSDVVARLMADAGARAAIADPAVRAALADAAVRSAMADAAVRGAMADAAVRAAMADAAVRGALADATVRAAMADAGVRAAMADATVRAIMADAAMRGALEN